MPSVDLGFSGQPDFLVHQGPTLMVNIGFDLNFPAFDSTHQRGTQGLLPALVDTGAATTCIDASLAATLNLPVINQRIVSGVHGEGVVNVHSGSIHVPALDAVFSGAFVGAYLAAGGQPQSAILGRDFLRHFRLTYDGITGAVTLSTV